MQSSELVNPKQNIIYLACRFLWRNVGLRRIVWLRSFWAFLNRLWLIIWDDPTRAQPYFERIYSETPDPWDYLRTVQQARYQTAIQALDEARQQEKFATALEIGCSEGMFTELLTERCGKLLALDISTVALGRAKDKCQRYTNIDFKQWDLSKDTLSETFDLVTIMDVLEYFYRPSSLRNVRDKIVSFVKPGGYLLVTTSKTHDFVESSHWARWLHCGKHCMTLMASHPDLTVCYTSEMELHVLTLFRKKS